MVQSWQGGPLWAAGRRWSQEQWQEMPSTQQEYTALWQGVGGGGSCSHGARLTCCWAWILMYSALCLPCLPLSGLPAWL